VSKNGLSDGLARLAGRFESASERYEPIRHVVLFGTCPSLGTSVAGDGDAADFRKKYFNDIQFSCYQMLGNALSRPGSLKTRLLAHNGVGVSMNDVPFARSIVYSEGDQLESRGYATFNQLAQQALKLTIATMDSKAGPWFNAWSTSRLHGWLVGLQLWAAAANHSVVGVGRYKPQYMSPAKRIAMSNGTTMKRPASIGPNLIDLGPKGCWLAVPKHSKQREFLRSYFKTCFRLGINLLRQMIAAASS
jgi:hypothetical protein